jgi:hypothetical protein
MYSEERILPFDKNLLRSGVSFLSAKFLMWEIDIYSFIPGVCMGRRFEL